MPSDKANDKTLILNPATGRYVKRDGITGRRVVNATARSDVVNNLESTTIAAALEHRNLIKSESLSDAELVAIMRKLVNLSGLNNKKAIPNKLLKAQPAKKVKQTKKPARKFVTRPAPALASGGDTAYYSDTETDN